MTNNNNMQKSRKFSLGESFKSKNVPHLFLISIAIESHKSLTNLHRKLIAENVNLIIKLTITYETKVT